MEILFESYNDGHREIVIDGKRFWVDETRTFKLSSTCPTGDKLPARVIRHKCRPEGVGLDDYEGANNKTLRDCITVCSLLLSRLYSEHQTPNEYLKKCIQQEIENTESLEKELRGLINERKA